MDWSIETWGVLVTFGIGVIAAIISGVALRKSHQANEISRDANAISRDANEIAKRALQVQELGVEAQRDSIHRSLRADLHIKPEVPRQSMDELAFFTVMNRGPKVADQLKFRITDSNLGPHGHSPMEAYQLSSLAPDKEWRVKVPLGHLLGQSEPHREHVFEITVDYADGTGNNQLRTRVTVEPGEIFVNRRITVSREEPTPDL